jgi:hypothetical protein
MKSAFRTLLVGAAAGYVAGQVMNQATTWFYGRQSDESKQREQEVLPEGAPVASARKLAGVIGAELPDHQLKTLALVMHESLGQLYGVVAASMTGRGVNPVAAGLASGAGAFVLVDELANSLFFTPPPQAYPVESHLRGVVGHLTLGVTTGALLTAARRLRLL